MTALVPFAVWKPVPSHSGPMQAHLGLVLHVQVGNGSCYGEFSVPANQASSTWWISKTGVLEQYVDADMAAWTEAAGNFTWDSVETEGTPDEALTPAQVTMLGNLYEWGAAAYGWPLCLSDDVNVRGLGWHGMGGLAWGGHFGCPGDLRKAQRAQAITVAPPKPPPPPQGEPSMFATDPASGKIVGTDAKGNLYCRPGIQPPLAIVTIGQHPEWGAGNVLNPVVDFLFEKDSDGSWGYTYVTAPVSGKGGFGPYDLFHINRNGSF